MTISDWKAYCEFYGVSKARTKDVEFYSAATFTQIENIFSMRYSPYSVQCSK